MKLYGDLTAEQKQAEEARLQQARLAAEIVLSAASDAGVIAETKLPTGWLMPEWLKLSEEEQQALLRPGGTEQIVAEIGGEQIKHTVRPSRKRMIEAACKLAGTTYEAARARMIDDTIERRRQARLETGI